MWGCASPSMTSPRPSGSTSGRLVTPNVALTHRAWRFAVPWIGRENASEAQRDRFLAAISQGASPVVAGTTPMVFPALNYDEVRHLVAAMADARRYLDGDVVLHLQRQLTSCAMADGVDGPKRTLPLVLGVVDVIDQQARHVKPDVRRDLLATLGR